MLIVLGVAIAGIGFVVLKPEKQPALALDSFAQCLAQKEVTMYGADWCPHCQKQKQLFGKSAKYLPYVDIKILDQLNSAEIIRKIKKVMRHPLLIDCKNFLDPGLFRDIKFNYHSIGVGNSNKKIWI